MKTKKTCRRCAGVLELRKVEHPYWNGPTIAVMVQGVPSWVCQVCGYHHFEPAVETALYDIVKDYITMGTLFPVPSTPYRTTAS